MQPNRKKTTDDSPKKKTLHTVSITDEQAEKLDAWLDKHLWAPFSVNYAKFAYKGPDVNVVAYSSGKVVIQGKGTEDFVQFVLEPEITGFAQLGYDEALHPEWYELHAGVDESGKGDLFGPLVSACVVADGDAVREWVAADLRESKKVSSDEAVLNMARKIKATKNVAVKVSYAGMEKYNALYIKFGRNLNRLLAWFHATAITSALNERHAPWGMLDQFTKQPLVQRQLDIPDFELKMRTKAEEDPVVAAASIIARATYIYAMRKLSDECGIKLKKGASADVRKQAVEIVKKFGAEDLKRFAKMHFKTASEAISEAEK
ncbi:ribonuclease HIII [Opitutia bacterium KCR 482]|nr:ribonuclease HIII [Opitutae bacterium KCR 482]